MPSHPADRPFESIELIRADTQAVISQANGRLKAPHGLERIWRCYAGSHQFNSKLLSDIGKIPEGLDPVALHAASPL